METKHETNFGPIYAEISETKIIWPMDEKFRVPQAHGAEVLFIGRVRDHNHGRNVVTLSYDSFAPLAEQTFREIAREAQEKWGQNISAAVVHRVGQLTLGDWAVIVAVSAKHRREAYQASRYIIENLKTRSPIWKKEHYEDGESEWLQGHALCQHNEGDSVADEMFDVPGQQHGHHHHCG